MNQKASIKDFYGTLMASHPLIQPGNDHSIIDVSGTDCVSNALVQVPNDSAMDASEYTVGRYRDVNEYSIQRILDSRRELSKSVSMILIELEIVAIGNNSGNNDVAVSKRTSLGKIALALIRASSPDG